jgi:outer membrane receptor for ferrienterochelin and colicin
MFSRTGSARAKAQLIRDFLLCGAAVILPVGPAFAAEAADTEDQQIESSRQIVVQAGIGYRNRSEEPEPVLVYDEEYFQRFEPLTAGDALKRVPSVTFLSDVIESDGARLRGLDPGYTQILVNGEKVPGANTDRSFFLDRIPAELVKQVEIIRSSSARRTGDAVAGTLNIVLRDAFTLDGGYVRGGGLYFDDGEVKPTAGLFYGGQVGPGRILIGANVQGRYNPKRKSSLRFGDSPENNPDYATDDFDNREDQTDTRDGTDYAANVAYGIDGETTDFEISGSYVRTDRTETERSFEYNDPTAVTGSVGASGNLLTDNSNVNEIDQESYNIAGKISHEWSLGKTTLKAGYARFDDKQDETEFEIDFEEDEPEFEGELTQRRLVDRELSFGLDHEFPVSESVDIVVGGFYQDKKRKTRINVAEQGADLPASTHGWNQFSDTPDDFVGDFDEAEVAPGGLNRIKEERKDVFALIEGERGPVKWEAGVRWENTSVDILVDPADEAVDPALLQTNLDYDYLLPSASLKWDTGSGRITASVARTVRRPRFDYVTPVTLEEELGDNDFRGNPSLRPESAWGGDLGYEHRVGKTGVIGVNVFYRKVKNLVEIVNTGEVREDDGDEFLILQPQNVGDGEVWGVEFDMSTSLSFVGLPDTGLFGNLSLIDSEIEDFAGKRRFNGQSKYVYNFGFIQNLRDFGAAFGATYRKQGPAFDRVAAEEVTTTYGADLEIFVEKRFGKNFTVRAVGSNLLDGKKREIFNKFDTIDDQFDRDFDEYELESERAGPVFQVVARYAF